MKTFATIIALTVATAIAGAGLRADHQARRHAAECEKDPTMKWNDQTKTCVKK
jgi:hypothetical protein